MVWLLPLAVLLIGLAVCLPLRAPWGRVLGGAGSALALVALVLVLA